jgi:hypothetical protein
MLNGEKSYWDLLGKVLLLGGKTTGTSGKGVDTGKKTNY